ncbi:UDP-3-O-(3-hydroxymyristoyl)glucosamine N-acyltransferase [Roseococcus sp. DSY-14]|uniref:UDP-3-O-(3-hydroxymyristoyl)glucosamine N-acyltransferase n=1 Tax=Roseococcus sp. DSY-14 TaxID=3369650 RepID=UPI00387B16C1
MAADPRFHPAAGPLPLAALLAAAGGATSDGDPARPFRSVAPLDAAGPEEVSFAEGGRNRAALAATRAGAVVVAPGAADAVPAGCIAILHPSPTLAFARIAARLHPPAAPSGAVHPSAAVDPTATLGEGTEVGAFAVIGAGARLGAGCLVGPHAVVGPGVEMGEGCRIHAHASVSHAVLGARCVLNAGARVGNEGFGFVPDGQGRYVTVPQLGVVVLEDEVEIGANSCVDRATLGETRIGRGTRVDNLVQIGHNVRLGRGCVLVSQVGVSGSTRFGDWVQAGGQAGFAGHLEVGAGARIGAQAGVIGNVPAGAEVFGTPALPVREAFRNIAVVRKLAAQGRGPVGKDG